MGKEKNTYILLIFIFPVPSEKRNAKKPMICLPIPDLSGSCPSYPAPVIGLISVFLCETIDQCSRKSLATHLLGGQNIALPGILPFCI